MISQLMQALARFRQGASLETFNRIFGDSGQRVAELFMLHNYDVIAFYEQLSDANRTLFEAHLAAQLPPVFYEPSRCVECGGELSESDIEAGEDVCLDCAAALMLERDDAGRGESGIDYEPGSLLATVRTRLEGGENG